ncbi:hypothetical protein [Parafrankia sp. EUN1f]|uniref:hypothetical protein n=1 Tax=Parafrankia sp. EUN1f TaxID=102897 RepID=UPI0001C46CFB|nr:hypothetical protein [Parafrankia sp. EUN1f]EFC80170.1 hypothetical protein FrEUN1fDRAFT_6699 [Parafrankia sp. EUN1f]
MITTNAGESKDTIFRDTPADNINELSLSGARMTYREFRKSFIDLGYSPKDARRKALEACGDLGVTAVNRGQPNRGFALVMLYQGRVKLRG